MLETKVYLSLGSNVGDREANLRAAIDELPHAGVAVTRVSSFYETEPVDLLEQPWFLNCAVEVQSHFDPVMLLRALREIEAKMGSKKLVTKGPRLMDLDILLYGAEMIDTPELQVPHPRMHLRRSCEAIRANSDRRDRRRRICRSRARHPRKPPPHRQLVHLLDPPLRCG